MTDVRTEQGDTPIPTGTVVILSNEGTEDVVDLQAEEAEPVKAKAAKKSKAVKESPENK